MTTNLDVINSVPRVATLIYQTHQLWQEFRGVPDGISGLVEHLKALEPIFAEIEDHFSQDDVSASFKNCLALSKNARDSLGILVADMRTQLQAKRSIKRKYATVKVMLNKAVLERLEQTLSRCMNFLQLAIQAYQMAMLRKLSSQAPAARVQPQRHGDVESSFQPLTQSPQKNQQPRNKTPQTQFGLIEYITATKEAVKRSEDTQSFHFTLSQYVRFALTYSKTTGAWQAEVKIPDWLSRSVYEFMSAPAIAGWTYSYRVYNVIPDDSEIIMKIHEGDVSGVRQMFTSRKASPFDKIRGKESLLSYATSKRQYEICQLLLKMGLQPLLDSGGGYNTPVGFIAGDIVSMTVGKMTWPASKDPKRIADLFASYLQEPDSLPAYRLLDFIQDFAADDMMVANFRNLFMPNYYLRWLGDRLEAVRLGAFNVLNVETLGSLFSKDGTFSKEDVSQSSGEKLSLVHSAAVAFGCRYPEKLVPYQKVFPWLHAYTECWDHVVVKIASVATLEDLTSIETVIPWDKYEVTAWEGTPLTSLIGGALCYLCPKISYNHWDGLFHGCLLKWLTLLQSAGVDLLEYGRREVSILRHPEKNTKGAFDADAIEASRNCVRHAMTAGTPRPKLHHMGYRRRGHKKFNRKGQDTVIDRSGEQYWIPFRIIDLEVGPNPKDWRLKWAPEFEHTASQFWRLIEHQETTMPGAWVD